MPDPDSLDEAMRRVRREVMATIDPPITFALEQLYTAWRNSMTEAGVVIDENVLKALMVTMTLLDNDDWQDLASKFGSSSVNTLVIAMLSTSIDPRKLL